MGPLPLFQVIFCQLIGSDVTLILSGGCWTWGLMYLTGEVIICEVSADDVWLATLSNSEVICSSTLCKCCSYECNVTFFSSCCWTKLLVSYRAKTVDKTMETFSNKSKSVEITDFTEMGQFHGRRRISRKMSQPSNHELGRSINIIY